MPTTAEHRRLQQTAAAEHRPGVLEHGRPGQPTGSGGAPTSATAPGARCARTTAPTANAWDYFPHDHARSRAYRWNEDGLAGFCDRDQHLCLGRGAVERARPDPEGAAVRAVEPRGQPRRGRQGVLLLSRQHADARLRADALQVSAGRVPVRAIWSRRTPRRGSHEPEYELFDAIGDAFRQQRYFDVFVEYAKAGAEDILCRISVVNRGPEPAPIHVLPHLWYRNTWSWTHGATAAHDLARTARARRTRRIPCSASAGGTCSATDWRDAGAAVHRERHQRRAAVRRAAMRRAYVKDGINDAVVSGRRERVNGERGSKVAAHVRAIVAPGETFTVHVRLSPDRPRPGRLRASTRRSPSGGARPTSSTPAPRGPPDRRRAAGAAAGVRRIAVVEAVLPLRRAPLAGRAIRRSRRRRPSAGTAATATGRCTSTTPTSC